MIKQVFALFFFLCSYLVQSACTCDVILPMTFESTAGVPVIFYGEVTKVSEGCEEESNVYFRIIEQYKGHVDSHQKVVYKCGTECGMSFIPGEKWIIYGGLKNDQSITVDWCSRSRRSFQNQKEDFYKGLLGSSFQEEMKFLRSNFEVNKVFKKGISERKYQQMNPKNIPWLLGIGAAFMLVGYLVFTRIKK